MRLATKDYEADPASEIADIPHPPVGPSLTASTSTSKPALREKESRNAKRTWK